MAIAIQWQLKFRVRKQASFDKCLAGAMPLLGPGSVASGGRPYWKMPELWECDATTPVVALTVAEQVLECLLAARRLGSGWLVHGYLSAESAEGFAGVFAVRGSGTSSHVAGLDWASFELVRNAALEITTGEPEA